MDGLPGMKRGLDVGRREKITPLSKMVGPLAPTKYHKGFYTTSDIFVVGLACLVIGLIAALYGPRVAENCRNYMPSTLKVAAPFPSLAEWR